jgi:tetratricopeptide (TPR) repeat protein
VSVASDPVLVRARAAAEAGAWGDVRATLEQDTIGTKANGARAFLLAEALLQSGVPRSATTWLDLAVPLLSTAGDRAGCRRAINMRGAAAFALGAFEHAAQDFGAALALARQDGDELLTARATNNLGAIAAIAGRSDEAIASFQLAIPSYQRLGHARGLAESWHNIANACRTRGELDSAEDADRRAIEFAMEAGNARLAAMGQVGRAEVALRRGDAPWARAKLIRAIKVFASLPDYLLEADASWLLAESNEALGDSPEADRNIAQGLRLARANEHRLQEAKVLKAQAQILLRRGDVAGALLTGATAREIFAALGSIASADEMADWLASTSKP